MGRRHLLAGVLQGPSRRLSGYRSPVCRECIKRIRDAHSKTKRQSRSFFLYALYQIYDLWRLPRRPIAPSRGRTDERSRFFSSISSSHQAFNRALFLPTNADNRACLDEERMVGVYRGRPRHVSAPTIHPGAQASSQTERQKV